MMRLGLEAGEYTHDVAVEHGISGVPISADQLANDGLDATLTPLKKRGLEVCQTGAFMFNPLSTDGQAQAKQAATLGKVIPLARETGLDGLEAITPKPQGDVSLEEMKKGLGEEIMLLDGIPAILFDSYYPLAALEEFARRVIELFAPRLLLGISDELSSTGEIDRIYRVAGIVDEYNGRSCG